MRNGKAQRAETLVTDFRESNAVSCYGDSVYVTETTLDPDAYPMPSGVYRFKYTEFRGSPIKLRHDAQDEHLVVKLYTYSKEWAVGANGLAHDYIEGQPHRRSAPGLGADFFVELDGLLRKIHDRDLAYLDLSKPENILVGDDGRPYLIDFGIAWHCPGDRRLRRGIWRWLPATYGTAVLREFQRADRYHLLKHWRRNEPESMSEEDRAASWERQGWTRIHGWLRVPYRALLVGSDLHQTPVNPVLPRRNKWQGDVRSETNI